MTYIEKTASKPSTQGENIWQKLFQRFRSAPPNEQQSTARDGDADVDALSNHLRADLGLPPVHEKADWRKHL